MTEKSKAQRLAVDLEDSCLFVGNEAAAELRRLGVLVDELVEALEIMIIGACAVGVPHAGERRVLQDAVDHTRTVLTKAKEQT